MRKGEMSGKILAVALAALMIASVLGILSATSGGSNGQSVSAAINNEVYFVPQDSIALYCTSREVEIRVNAIEFMGGQICLTYNATCADVTDCFICDEGPKPFFGWCDISTPGEVWITFTALEELSGDYLVGTLTIHCVCEDGCVTALQFVEGAAGGSALFDPWGEEIPATWEDGTFQCIPGVCGDVAPYPYCDGIINMGDVVLLLSYVGYPGKYEICCEWCGDIAPYPDCDGAVNMGDVVVMLNCVGHPWDPWACQFCCG